MDKETLNRRLEVYWTISWFVMDACWMFGYPMLAIVPALVAIACAEYNIMRMTRGENTVAAFANACWLVMNVSWMLQDVWPTGFANDLLSYMKGAFLITGAICILLIGWKHKDALWYFRRFRMK